MACVAVRAGRGVRSSRSFGGTNRSAAPRGGQKSLKFVTLLVLALSVRSGAQAAPPSQPAAKTVAVGSVLPASGHFFHVAVIRFGNACKLFDLAGFNLENTIYFRCRIYPVADLQASANVRAAGVRDSHVEHRGYGGVQVVFPTIGEQVRTMAHPQPTVDLYLIAWGRHTDNRCMDVPKAYGIGVTT